MIKVNSGITIIPIYEIEFSFIEDLVKHQQLFHYHLDSEHNERFLNIGIKEFTEYMTKEFDYICYVALRMGDPVGYIACTISKEADVFESFIEDLFVESTERNSGIGSYLMDSLFKKLKEKNINTIKVHVTKNNESVFRFYEKFEFRLDSNDCHGYILIKY